MVDLHIEDKSGGNMKTLLLASSLILSSSILAAPAGQLIGSLKVEEISSSQFEAFANDTGGASSGETKPEEKPEEKPKPTFDERIQQTGKVIQVARDMVALGEAVYDLVKKGRPSNITEYAPISVVPRDPTTKEILDPFELEGFSMPVEKNYVAKIVNGVGKEVVTFSYKVLFSYGGSYNGIGKYLTNVIIVPGSIRTSYGWDFNATMKLSGIMNHGSKANPVAGIMVTVKYQMNSWSAAFERNDTIHITGNGEIKNHNMP